MRRAIALLVVPLATTACSSTSSHPFTQEDAGTAIDSSAPDDASTTPPPCEVSMDGGVALGTPSCSACANTSCCSSVNDCASSAECGALVACLSNCPADAGATDGGSAGDCEHACRAESPNGIMAYEALTTCASSRCASDCRL